MPGRNEQNPGSFELDPEVVKNIKKTYLEFLESLQKAMPSVEPPARPSAERSASRMPLAEASLSNMSQSLGLSIAGLKRELERDLGVAGESPIRIKAGMDNCYHIELKLDGEFQPELARLIHAALFSIRDLSKRVQLTARKKATPYGFDAEGGISHKGRKVDILVAGENINVFLAILKHFSTQLDSTDARNHIKVMVEAADAMNAIPGVKPYPQVMLNKMAGKPVYLLRVDGVTDGLKRELCIKNSTMENKVIVEDGSPSPDTRSRGRGERFSGKDRHWMWLAVTDKNVQNVKDAVTVAIEREARSRRG